MSVPLAVPPRLCVELPWDSEFFGLAVARFDGSRLSRQDAAAAARFCAEHAIDCLYLLLDADDAAGIATAQEYGARFVDVRVTLEGSLDVAVRPGTAAVMPSAVRPATEDDVPALRRVAAVSHRDSRFYADSRFDASRVDLMYQTWIEKSCRGGADAVLVIESAGEAAGYVTCHRDEGEAGRIGLVAVRADLRGQGAGGRLLQAARDWLIASGCRSWTIVTQGANVAASRLYQASGLRTASVQVWLHLWATESGDRGRL